MYGRMKKALFAIAVLCYFTAASGVVVNSHYCMKRLVSVKLFAKLSDRCDRCGMKMHEKHGCCHDEVKVIMLKQDPVKSSGIVYEMPSAASFVSVPSAFIVSSFYNSNEQLLRCAHPPPLLSEQDTHLQINVFRI